MAFFPFDTLVSEMVKLFTVEVTQSKGPDTRYIALSPTMASSSLAQEGCKSSINLMPVETKPALTIGPI